MTGALAPTHLVEKGVKQAQQIAKHEASSVLTCGRQELVGIQRRELIAVWVPHDKGLP